MVREGKYVITVVYMGANRDLRKIFRVLCVVYMFVPQLKLMFCVVCYNCLIMVCIVSVPSHS
jgi:hypothetical protein